MTKDSTTAAERKELFVFVATEKRGNATIASYYPIDGVRLVYRDGGAYFSISDDCAAYICSLEAKLKIARSELENANSVICSEFCGIGEIVEHHWKCDPSRKALSQLSL